MQLASDEIAVPMGAPTYDHLVRLSDDVGIFEHALILTPRTEHGYCVDDVARALLVVTRETEQTPEIAELGEIYLRFVESSLDRSGRAHNRKSVEGKWTDSADVGDWWGRAIWALGVTSVLGLLPLTRHRAARAFRLAIQQRSPNLRTMAFAAIGASYVLRENPRDDAARNFLRDALAAIPESSDPEWPWPEPRLRYGNGSVAEALILGGEALGDATVTARGIQLLQFLVATETRDGHLSVTGTRGRGQGDMAAQFDQQPIEIAAIADAAGAAFDATGDPQWKRTIELSWAWFLGANDANVVMVSVNSGVGHDGLHERGRNENGGAESTLAMLSTYQQLFRVTRAADRD